MDNISVIIACRNEEHTINDVLRSLENQTIKPQEVVIVDDASTDDTCEIIQEIIKKNDWILFRRDKNDERYVSIVNALKIATTLLKKKFDYLMVLDADTILEPQYIEKIISKFYSNTSLGIAGGNLKVDGKDYESRNSDLVFGCNRIYSEKCWFDTNAGKIMKVSSFAWDPEHSIKAKARGYTVKRYDDVNSHSLRPPSLKVPSFTRGILYYQFGHTIPSALISAINHHDLKFLVGYISAWKEHKVKIDTEDNMKKIKKIYNFNLLNTIFRFIKLKLNPSYNRN